MINFYFADLAKLVLAFVLALIQSDATIAAAHTSMITVGDKLDGMTLAKGAADARPLWAFCASEVNKNVTTANCRVPQLPKLAIGHVFLGSDEAFTNIEWSELNWEIYVDDQLIQLNDFGTYDYVLPIMAPNPSLIREVFVKFTAWDIVLTNLQPGAHTLDGRVRSSDEEYRWKVNLWIEDEPESLRNLPEDKDSSGPQSRCPVNIQGLSHFQHSCMFYG
jgi:hypothetical protein